MKALTTGLSIAAALALLAAAPVTGQRGQDPRTEAFAGSELEEYLRVLQVAGRAPLFPWSVRGFSPAQVARMLPADSVHPWASRLDTRADSAGGRLRWVSPYARLVANTAAPYGANDGPVWAGRGFTGSIQAGVAYRSRHLWATLAPVAFLAQNAGFTLRRTGFPGVLTYADDRYLLSIDLPQRFGRGAYGRVDPGESTIGVEAGAVALGVSTASQVWGPASEYPLLLGNNAGGFPRVYLGTSRPVGIGIGTIHGRVMWGQLAQSPFSSVPADSGRRFMTGAVAVFQPRGIAGLELGAARFFHARWPDRLSDAPWGLAFEGVLKSSLGGKAGEAAGSDQANQLASAFFRWAAPRDGFEAWGEFAREDHSYDLRDFVMEPDHSAAMLLGFRKVWPRGASLVSLRAEVADARVAHLALVRGESPFYIHSERVQGHTLRGQILGSPAVYGGGGATLQLDTYSPTGGWSVLWRRELLGEFVTDGRIETFGARNTLGVSHVRFTRHAELRGGVQASLDLGSAGRGDRLNLNTTLEARLLP